MVPFAGIYRLIIERKTMDPVTDVQRQILDKYGEDIDYHHFQVIDGEVYLAGMDPMEWAYAMFEME
jgi:hypothetical protein